MCVGVSTLRGAEAQAGPLPCISGPEAQSLAANCSPSAGFSMVNKQMVSGPGRGGVQS